MVVDGDGDFGYHERESHPHQAMPGGENIHEKKGTGREKVVEIVVWLLCIESTILPCLEVYTHSLSYFPAFHFSFSPLPFVYFSVAGYLLGTPL